MYMYALFTGNYLVFSKGDIGCVLLYRAFFLKLVEKEKQGTQYEINIQITKCHSTNPFRYKGSLINSRSNPTKLFFLFWAVHFSFDRAWQMHCL